MDIVIGVLCIAALVLAWAERRTAAHLVKLSEEYMVEGNKSWDRGEKCFQMAIDRAERVEARMAQLEEKP